MDKFKTKERNEIEEKYKWDVSKIFKTDADWEKEYQSLKEDVKQIIKYKGKLTESSKTLAETLKLYMDLSERIGKMYVYSGLRHDEDSREPKYQEINKKAISLVTEASSYSSFLSAELVKANPETIRNYLTENEDLKLYEKFLENILRKKDHILSEGEEEILSKLYEVNDNAASIFSIFMNADIKYPKVKVEGGGEVELTSGNYTVIIESKDRDVRKGAFEAKYKTINSFINTLGQTLAGEVKKNVVMADIRNFNTAREAALFENNVPVSVYDSLLESVHKNIGGLHRFMDLRKRIMGYDELHMYDIYTPILGDVEMNFTFEEAREIVLDALKPLGEEYQAALKEGFENRWVDVYENTGKRSGAYSSGTYGTDPYILLNYHETLDNVFTLAHELGHSIHSYFTKKYQPYVYGNYPIFLAEVASTLNENMLVNYFLEKEKDPAKKRYIINQFLDTIRGTLYRQTQFAEFEKIIHEYVEAGGAITHEYLSEEYFKLNKFYYGSSIISDDQIKLEWARIPHFYYNFYVFQYATGISASIALSNKILKEGEPALNNYLNFLKSGSTEYPVETLKKAGVDMTTTEPVDSALKLFNEMIDKFEELM